MARMEFEGMDALAGQMQRMGQLAGPVAEEMVNAGVQVIQDEWKLSAATHGHVRTGAMVASIRPGKLKGLGGSAIFRDVYPQGKDGKGVRNAEKAYILQYGRSYGRTKKPGDWWVEEAEKNAEPAVMETIREIWQRFLASGGK